MTERCQMKNTERIDDTNYIIYVGFVVTSIAVLYFYRFHFATITFSYVLGCLVCYYGLKSSFLINLLDQLKCHFVQDTSETEVLEQDSINKGCVTCGSKDCPRHDTSVSMEPWVGLQIHKQLDQAIEDFYNTILDQFINIWYNKITPQPFFVDELRQQLRYASACLLRRAVKINYSRFITERLVPCALRHYAVCAGAGPDAGGPPDGKMAVHPAAANRNAELKYLRCIANALMPYLLKNTDLQSTSDSEYESYSEDVAPVVVPPPPPPSLSSSQSSRKKKAPLPGESASPAVAASDPKIRKRKLPNASAPSAAALAEDTSSSRVYRVLVREIVAGWALLPLADVLADPHTLNTLLVLATGEETMAPLPAAPDYKVEFLEGFARQTESAYSRRRELLRLDLEAALADQRHLYALMQHTKTTGGIHLLQFYKDIKSFQTKILNPELSPAELAALDREALGIYERCLAPAPLAPPAAAELARLLRAGVGDVKRLQTSRALYEAARQSHKILEKIMLPKFLHSEEYYKMMFGSRTPTGFQKHMVKRPQEKLKLSQRRKEVDGRPPNSSADAADDVTDGADDVTDGDLVGNVDLLQYLDSLAGGGQDLRDYKVVLTDVDIRLQAPPRRGPVRVFTVAVHRAGPPARLWTVQRDEHAFHLLRSKLLEFHGERPLHDLPLPSRRDNSPLENLRYKYEDFLQRLLQKTLLQTSELVHLFLTVQGDFSLVVQASTLNAAGTDLVNIYQSVTHKLRKEKGQHLENFLKNFLVSSDMERYQALKQGSARDVDDALEASEAAEAEPPPARREPRARDIHSTVFGNNMDVEVVPLVLERNERRGLAGFTQCFMYILIKVIRARGFVSAIVGCLLSLSRETIDNLFNLYLNRTLCNVVSERRLAHLIRLGQGIIFNKRPAQRASPAELRSLVRQRLLACAPAASLLAGAGLRRALADTFDVLQQPRLNKQLVYNLLDLCLVELFPELTVKEEPKC